MRLEWFVANVTAVEFPDRAERASLGVIVAGRFFSIQDVFVVGEPVLRCRNPLLSPSNIVQGHLMKLEWLVTY